MSGINPHAIRIVAASLRNTTEAHIANGMYAEDDPPLEPMSLYLSDVLAQLHILGFKELVLLERHNVPAASGSDRCFCYIAAQAPNGVKLCWQMNLNDKHPQPIDVAHYIANRSLAWDGITPVEYAVHQMEGPSK